MRTMPAVLQHPPTDCIVELRISYPVIVPNVMRLRSFQDLSLGHGKLSITRDPYFRWLRQVGKQLPEGGQEGALSLVTTFGGCCRVGAGIAREVAKLVRAANRPSAADVGEAGVVYVSETEVL